MGPHDSLDVYIMDIDERCRRLQLDEKTKLSTFVRGLKQQLRAYVIQQNPRSFDEATHAARLAQEAVSMDAVSMETGTKTEVVLATLLETVT